MHTISVSMQHLKVSIGIEYCNRQAFLLLQHRKLNTDIWEIHSVQFSLSVVSNCLWPHESQHTRPPCPSQTPGVYSNSCPLSRWWHPAISSSVIPFSSCPQSLPASRSFPTSQLFPWGGQSIWSFSFSISPSNEHPGLISFRMDWLDLLAVFSKYNSHVKFHNPWRKRTVTVLGEPVSSSKMTSDDQDAEIWLVAFLVPVSAKLGLPWTECLTWATLFKYCIWLHFVWFLPASSLLGRKTSLNSWHVILGPEGWLILK